MTREEVLEQLKKANVNNLDDFADLIVREAHPGGDPSKEAANSVIIYPHGFVTS